jgi:glutamate dehydrogenase (NADP+)/cyclic pyranopterin phosphate synthase/molybdopterin-guanine dinucleotide biosynthesis protein A
MLTDLPVFGICGHSESGKTTLIEALVPRLVSRGLSVAVAKHHVKGIDVDRPGKDSDRLFRAGADVFMQGPDEGFVRTHPSETSGGVRQLTELAGRYDLVLVEGRHRVDCTKVWLLSVGESQPPPEAGGTLATLARTAGRVEAVWNILEPWLRRQWLKPPVYGAVLIGGASSRMGRPKHLLRRKDKTWLEHTAGCLARVAERVVIVGSGDIPEALREGARLPDAPDARGPMAGLLSAMRWAPQATWLVSACDLPKLSVRALKWLLSTRAPGVWATLPRLPGREGVEPLLACYDFRARALLEEAAGEGRFSPSLLAGHRNVISPTPPDDLLAAWQNVNTPEDLSQTETGGPPPGQSHAG